MIVQFKGKYFFLSNFYKRFFVYDRISYNSVEAAFQAQKTLDESERFLEFSGTISPSKAKQKGRRVNLRPDWEEVKVPIMKDIVREKFKQNDDLMRRLLIDTGNEELVEGNYWGDTFWGVDLKTNEGENHLGIILMELRDEFRKEKYGL